MLTRFPPLLVGNAQDSVSHHHHLATPEATLHSSPTDLRRARNFYPTYPITPSSATSVLPPSSGLDRVGARSSNTTAVAAPALKTPVEDGNAAFFGDLQAQDTRRRFVLVEDPMKGNQRIRVNVRVDQVDLDEMPDSFRKLQSVYPRSFFKKEMQSPPSTAYGGQFSDDVDSSDEDNSDQTNISTLVEVPMADGSKFEVAVPRMTRSRRRRELDLNDLGYRLSWTHQQGGPVRTFDRRPIFLQKARTLCDALEGPYLPITSTRLTPSVVDLFCRKSRESLESKGISPPSHIISRPGKRRWEVRVSRITRRDATP